MIREKSRIAWAAGSAGVGLALALAALWLSRTPGADTLDPAGVAGTMKAPERGWPLEFKTVDWSASGPYRNRVQALIRSEADWQALNDHERPVGAPVLPLVDWEHSALVLVTLGENNSGARELEVVGVRQDGGELLVDVQVREANGAAPGSPFHLIEVPASDAENVVVREVPIEDADRQESGPRSTTWGSLKKRFGS